MMRPMTLVRGFGLIAVLTAGGCRSLDITNPNDPDAPRALSDPAAIEAVAGGSMRVWINAWQDMDGGGPLVVQARTYSASWNNFNMNFYAQVDNPADPPATWHRNTRSWQNNPSSAARTAIEAYWDQCYRSLSLATNVLKAIRLNGLVINNAADTRRTEAVAVLVQGLSLSCIALNYDKGYIVDENVDLGSLTYSDRAAVRDAALAKFDDAISIANANTFTTPSGWANGPTYTNVQVAKIANTMAAFLIANWPRDAAENAAADWPAVVAYALNGMSTGGSFNWTFVGDGCSAWCPEILVWFNSLDTGRIHTRLARMLDLSQTDPWPLAGNPQPSSADQRMGDGTFGVPSMVTGFGNAPITGGSNPGTDFAWSSQAIFNMARGFYQQSNIGHIRYDLSGVQSTSGIYFGYGPAPIVNGALNDLLLAEGYVRQNTNLATAATLIDNTRVGRGGLASVAGGNQATLQAALNYEYEIEALGLGAASYYLQRRLGTLLPGTPHEMPVPAKELGVFAQPLYTWGGSNNPPNSPTPP